MISVKSLGALVLVLLISVGCATGPQGRTAVSPATSEELVAEHIAGLGDLSAAGGPRVIVTGTRHKPKPEVVGEFTFRHKCSKLMAGTQHVPYIAVDLLVSYEESLGAKKVNEALGHMLRPNYSEYCEAVAQRPLAELVEDPVMYGYARRFDDTFPVGIISAELLDLRVEFPEEFWRATTLKTLPKARPASTPPKSNIK